MSSDLPLRNRHVWSWPSATPGMVGTVLYLQLGQPVAAKALLLSCGLFLYAFAPQNVLPTIPGEPQSLLVAAGLFFVGPLIYNTYR